MRIIAIKQSIGANSAQPGPDGGNWGQFRTTGACQR